MTTPSNPDTLVYRQSGWTRLTHWIWAISPVLPAVDRPADLQRASRALYRQAVGLRLRQRGACDRRREQRETARAATREIFGTRFDTTGVLGLSRRRQMRRSRGFPAWATIPSYQDLGTGRVIHFFFAWVLVGTLLVWLVASLINGHLRRDLAPRGRRHQKPAARHRRPRQAEIPSHAANTTRCRNSPMAACCSSCCR